MGKKHRVELLTEARLQLRDIAAYHKRLAGPQSARKITDRILNELEKLTDFPMLGVTPPAEMAAKAGYRMLIVGDYLCFYLVSEEQIYVTHIVHGSTDYMRILLG